MYVEIFRETSQSILYLYNMEVARYPVNYHLPIGMKVLVDLWPDSSHCGEVRTLSFLIAGAVILATRRSDIFPSLG